MAKEIYEEVSESRPEGQYDIVIKRKLLTDLKSVLNQAHTKNVKLNYLQNRDVILKALNIIWDYMKMNHTLEPADIIMGCGCSYMDVPVKCARLYKEGYASKILFAGGVGKRTKHYLNKSEAELYRNIAVSLGVREEDVLIEPKSTNTGDNFKFGREVLNQNGVNVKKMIIVHGPLSERRTYSAAKTTFLNEKVMITSPDMSFNDFVTYLNLNIDNIVDIISVIVGDIQRLVIFPQFGWQIENDVPEEVLIAYEELKQAGFTKYLIDIKEIDKTFEKVGLSRAKERKYFI